MTQPPDSFSARPATLTDAEAILAVGLARDIADVGRPDWAIEDVEAELTGSSLALERDTLVVSDAAGEIVAFAVVDGIDARVAVHPDACGNGIGTFLAGEVERRARDAGAGTLRQEIMSTNSAGTALLQASGYELSQSFLRLGRALDGSEPAPRWPEGIAARPTVRGSDDRSAHELISVAFREIPGNTERTFEEWAPRALGAHYAPELSFAAEDGDGLAGIAICDRRAEEDAGYVGYIAVDKRWRGRGLGRALMLASLRGFAEAGLGSGVVWVNDRNATAMALYRAVGMDPEFSADRYVKPLAP